jgi:ABC-2 type transport system ATP-binding protein
VITVEHLTKEFGAIRAVQDVSFTVPAGAIVGLLGPNGSGKTTVMRVLTGFFPPTAGRACIGGIDVTEDPIGVRAKVGYLPESVVLYPDMRVVQFLEFGADVRRLTRARRRARLTAVRDDCGLEAVWHRLIGTLSKGYRQRVGLAQALLHEPDVLILDEPTVGLDPRQIVEMRGLIAGLRGRTTVLLSTHILSEAAAICDRIVIIDRGRVIAEDGAALLTRGSATTEQVLLRVAAPAAAVQAALETVRGVERVAVDYDADACVTDAVVSAHGGDEVRAAIAAMVVHNGWRLLELRPRDVTLEDAFLRAVSAEGMNSDQ